MEVMKEQLGRSRQVPKHKPASNRKATKVHEYVSPDGNDKKACVFTAPDGHVCGLHKPYPIHDFRKPPGVGLRPQDRK